MNRTDSIISRFPHFYQSGDRFNDLYQYIETFAQLLDGTEDDLRKVLRADWVNTADNEDSKGFDSQQKGDLDKIFSLFMENLGGTSLLKQTGRRTGDEGIEDDVIYRERIKGLIQVLLNGASTKQGIIDIVAANLGVVGDDQMAIDAKKLIRVIEFQPKLIGTGAPFVLKPFQPFTITNPNPSVSGAEIRFSIHPGFPLNITRFIIRQTSGGSGQFFGYAGGMVAGDRIVITEDGRVRKNSLIINDDLLGQIPQIAVGQSDWIAEIYAEYPEGIFDQTIFDFSAFDEVTESIPGLLDGFDAMDMEVNLLSLRPASFTVVVPWDIPGFTEKLDSLSDQPRNQIPFIVNKVKAAGVYAEIEYYKKFEVTHEIEDHLASVLVERQEIHQLGEGPNGLLVGTFQQPPPIVHEMGDTLLVSGVFDYTEFDSLNTFA